METRALATCFFTAIAPLLLDLTIGHTDVFFRQTVTPISHISNHGIGVEMWKMGVDKRRDTDDAFARPIDTVGVRWFIKHNTGITRMRMKS